MRVPAIVMNGSGSLSFAVSAENAGSAGIVQSVPQSSLPHVGAAPAPPVPAPPVVPAWPPEPATALPAKPHRPASPVIPPGSAPPQPSTPSAAIARPDRSEALDADLMPFIPG